MSTMHAEPTPVAGIPARLCTHCGAASSTRFCGECGRPMEVAPAAAPRLLRESVAEVLGVEHGLWGTLRDLLIRPVKVFYAYLDGSADGYVRPLKLFFLLAGAYMLLLSIVRPVSVDLNALLQQSPELGRSLVELLARRGITQTVLEERMQGRMNTATPLVIALALLPMALLLKAMRRDRPFADHVMFMLTFSNCVWLVSLLSVPLMLVAPGAVTVGVQPLAYVYLGLGFFSFYRARTRALTALKFAGYVLVDLTVTYTVGLLLLAAVLLSVLYF